MPLLFKLLTLGNTLKILNLVEPLGDLQTQNVLEQVVPHLYSLTEYVCHDVGPPSEGLLNALARSPALRVLDMNAKEMAGRPNGLKWLFRKLLVTPNAFAKLRQLSLQDFSLSSVTSLLNAMRNSELLSISLSNPWGSSDGDYAKALVIFAGTLAKSYFS